MAVKHAITAAKPPPTMAAVGVLPLSTSFFGAGEGVTGSFSAGGGEPPGAASGVLGTVGDSGESVVLELVTEAVGSSAGGLDERGEPGLSDKLDPRVYTV